MYEDGTTEKGKFKSGYPNELIQGVHTDKDGKVTQVRVSEPFEKQN